MEKSIYNEDLHRQTINNINQVNQVLTIGMKAPDFTAETTFGIAKMSDFSGKWVVLFSHPRGFYSRMYDRIYLFC